MAVTAHLTVVAPDNEKFTVRSAPARLPRRKSNAEYRSQETKLPRASRSPSHREISTENSPAPLSAWLIVLLPSLEHLHSWFIAGTPSLGPSSGGRNNFNSAGEVTDRGAGLARGA